RAAGSSAIAPAPGQTVPRRTPARDVPRPPPREAAPRQRRPARWMRRQTAPPAEAHDPAVFGRILTPHLAPGIAGARRRPHSVRACTPPQGNGRPHAIAQPPAPLRDG